ncbi:unnamed protein product, partial [Didymodactylos carnosus]
CQNEPREDFYLLSLAKLKDFGADYDAIKSKNLDISRIINTFTIAAEPVTEFNPIDHEIDELSRNLLLRHPNPAIRKLVPISVNGDGDCLFYTLQVFYPDMSIEELRLRSISELCSHENYHAAVVNGVLDLVDDENVDNHVKRILNNGQYGGVLTLSALSSVFEREIQSIYPDINENDEYFGLLNRSFYPRPYLKAVSSPLIIMWSGAEPQTGQIWRANHFVPLLSSTENQDHSTCATTHNNYPSSIKLHPLIGVECDLEEQHELSEENYSISNEKIDISRFVFHDASHVINQIINVENENIIDTVPQKVIHRSTQFIIKFTEANKQSVGKDSQGAWIQDRSVETLFVMDKSAGTHRVVRKNEHGQHYYNERKGRQYMPNILVGTAMRFLSTLAARSHHCAMFQGDETLKTVCEQVILPNLFLREADIEEFEDNPEEYIRKDIEKSDFATRRRAAGDFLQALCIFFEPQVVALYSQYIDSMLQDYIQNPTKNWTKKDISIFLVLALASKGETQKFGITRSSHLISIQAFFISAIYPELQDQDVNRLPLIKADCLKFFTIVRNQLDNELLLRTLPECGRYLLSTNIVTQTYAAHAIERVLLVKQTQNKQQLAITKTDLIPHAQMIFDHLFKILNSDKSYENEYVMRAVMRLSYSLQDGIMPYLNQLMEKLVIILKRTSKNPNKPNFNHYLFETISLLIRTSCTQNPQLVEQFEGILFPVFTPIFSEDVAEFVPYVLQIIGFLLESRTPSTQTNPTTIPDSYRVLFPLILTPSFWDRSGNIPALSRLLQAYIQKAGETIVVEKITTVLGVFQRLVDQSKLHDQEGFHILQSLIIHVPQSYLTNYFRDIFILIFTRLTRAKTQKLIKCIIVLFCYFIAKYGAQELITLIDSIQQNMFSMVCERLFIPHLDKVDREDKKICAIGMTRLLTEAQAITQGPYMNLWVSLLQSLIRLFEVKHEITQDNETEIADIMVALEDTPDYTPAFSRLAFAKKSNIDLFGSEIPDPRVYLAKCLSILTAANPTKFTTMMSNGLVASEQQSIQNHCLLANVQKLQMANSSNTLDIKEKSIHNSNLSLNSNHSRMNVNLQTPALSKLSSNKYNFFTRIGHYFRSLYKRFKSSHTQLTEIDIQILISLTPYTREQIQEWHKRFLCDCPNGFRSRKQFIQTYRQLFPKGDAERFTKHVYRACDLDKSGQVDFREFLIGLGMTSANATPKQKLEWTFKVFDIDGNGYLTRKECCEVIEAIVGLTSNDERVEELAKQRMMKTFDEIDEKNRGQLTMNQFIRGCEKDPLILNLLLPSETTMPSITNTSSIF